MMSKIMKLRIKAIRFSREKAITVIMIKMLMIIMIVMMMMMMRKRKKIIY